MITTIKVKDLIKYLVILMLSICVVVFVTRFFLIRKNKSNFKSLNLIKSNKTFLSCIDKTITFSRLDDFRNNKNSRSTKKTTSRSILKRMLDLELPNIEEQEINNNAENNTDKSNQSEQNEKKERIQIKDTYTNQYKSVKIKNLTNIKLTEDMLKPNYKVKNKKDIIIFHTHTCESYTQTENNKYTQSRQLQNN